MIDLGGLSLEVISLPGHTPGNMSPAKRVASTVYRRRINRHLWMQLKESLPLKAFLENQTVFRGD